jgi:predicted RNA methylase
MLGKLKEAVFNYTEQRNDRKFGINTHATFRARDINSDDPELHFYSSISYKRTGEALSLVKVDPGKDVFVDYGSGLGRVVVLAATLPYKRVMGVELSKQLHDDAVINIGKAKPKLFCKNIDLVNEDARTFHVPDDLTVAYFWSPFGSEILHTVLSNIHKSVKRVPRDFRIIYVYAHGMSCIETIRPQMPWLKNYVEQPLGSGLTVGLGTVSA